MSPRRIRPPDAPLYRDSLRPWAWGRRVGTSNEGRAILVREDGEPFVVPVARLRRKKRPKTTRTLKQRRSAWSNGAMVEEVEGFGCET